MATRSFPTRNDLPPDNRKDLVALLNQHLADTLDLHAQTKYAHWNVKGPGFISLHKLFDELADKDTADLFTGVSRDLDKSLWFLEAHLQG